MSSVSVNRQNAQNHVGRILGVARDYSSDKAGIIRGQLTTLSAVANGNASFDESIVALMELAYLSEQLTSSIGTLSNAFTDDDQ